MMKRVSDCKTVEELLSHPSRWIKGAMAKDVSGNVKTTSDPRSEKFCLLGAVKVVYPIEERKAAIERLQAAIGGGSTVRDFNDSAITTHYDVMQVVRKAGV